MVKLGIKAMYAYGVSVSDCLLWLLTCRKDLGYFTYLRDTSDIVCAHAKFLYYILSYLIMLMFGALPECYVELNNTLIRINQQKCTGS